MRNLFQFIQGFMLGFSFGGTVFLIVIEAARRR